MTEANAQRRHARPEAADQLDGDSRVRRTTRAGRNEQLRGLERFRLRDGDGVVPEDPHVRAQLLEEVDEVVGERVVVVDD